MRTFECCRTRVRLTAVVFVFVFVFAVAGTAHAQGSADCKPLERQLGRDKLALTRQQQSIREGLRDLEEWTKANEEAQRDAVLRGARLVADIAVTKLERAASAARLFEQFLSERKVPLYLLANSDARTKVEQAYHAYKNAGAAARGARVLNAGLLANDLWHQFQHEIAAVAHIEGGADAAIRQVIDSPDLRSYLQADARGSVVLSELTRSLVELGAQSTTATKWFDSTLAPAMSLASFTVDYGYEATKWYQSRQRILERARVSERELAAVNALKTQIERTVGRLQGCRARGADARISIKAAVPTKPGNESTGARIAAAPPGKAVADCTNPAFDAAMRQQRALLERGDPASVQAAGTLSHGGRGPSYYIPIMGSCGGRSSQGGSKSVPTSGSKPRSTSASSSAPRPASAARDSASRQVSVPNSAKAAPVPPARSTRPPVRATAAPSPTSRKRLAAAQQKALERVSSTAATANPTELAGSWIIEGGAASMSGMVSGQHVSQQIPRTQSRVTIVRVADRVYQWTETGNGQSIRTTFRRQSPSYYAGSVDTTQAPPLPGVTLHGLFTFRMRDGVLVGETRQTASGEAGSIEIHSNWEARRVRG